MRMAGESLPDAMQRCVEQRSGQRMFDQFIRYFDLDDVMSLAIDHAASEAMLGRYRSSKTSQLIVKGIGESDVDLSCQTTLTFVPHLFEGNTYAYNGNHERYMHMINTFSDELNRWIRKVYPELRASVKTGYGSTKFKGTYTFTFFITLYNIKAEMQRAA